jgi:hypothetical protein
MKAGDTVEVEVEHIGILRNPIVAADTTPPAGKTGKGADH